MSVVGVVGVVVVGGGGEQLLYIVSPRAHVWSQPFQKQNPLFLVLFAFFQKLMYGLNAHVWWAQGEKRIKRKVGGVPLHSKIIVREKVVGLKYLYWTTYPLLSHYDFRMKSDPPPLDYLVTPLLCIN